MNGAHKSILYKVESSIQKQALCKAGARLLLGVSGGVDSVVLLDILQRLSGKYGWQMQVAHINHQLRGRESERDARFVADLAASRELPCYIIDAPPPARGNLQEEARYLRYALFAQLMRDERLDQVVVAHHADDQLELLLMRLTSGVGLHGAGGMQALRDGWIARPLLEVGRQEIVAYAKSRRLRYVEDSSNRRGDYLRNRLRRNLLPLLKASHPTASDNLLNFMNIVRLDDDFIDSVVQAELKRRTVRRSTDEWVVDLKDFWQLHAALPPRLVQAAIEGFAGKTVGRRQRQAILHLLAVQDGTQELHLDKTLTVYREYDRLVLRHRQARGAQGTHAEAAQVALSEMRQLQLQLAGHRVVISPGTCLNGALPFEEGRIWLAKTQLGDQLQLRLWQPGDRIRLPWSGYRKKLKRYFIDKKISRYHRQRTVVVVDGERVAAFLNAPGIVGGTLVDRDYLTSSTASSLVGIAIEGSLV